MASNSLDACAALLLHGAEARTFARAAVPGSPVQQLLELFAGRAPGQGELPKLVNAVDPLLRPQVAQNLMSLAQAAAAPPAPAPAAPAAPGAPARPSAYPNGSHGAAFAPHSTAPRAVGSAAAAAAVRSAPQPVNRTSPSTVHPGSNGHAQSRPSEGKIASTTGMQRQPARTDNARQQMQVPQRESPQTQRTSRVPHGSSLGRAAAADDLVEVTSLLKSRAEPNDYDKKGETPLFTAVALGSPDVVASLLLCNAEPLTKSIHGVTPWDVASCNENRSLLSFFAGQELEDADRLQLLDSLSAMQEAIEHAISERAANRRGLRPAEELPEEALAATRQRPLPPLPPEVKKARDAMAAQDMQSASVP